MQSGLNTKLTQQPAQFGLTKSNNMFLTPRRRDSVRGLETICEKVKDLFTARYELLF